MTDTFYIAAKLLALPPLNCFALATLGLVLRRWHPRTGRSCLYAGLGLLYFFCTPLAGGLARTLIEPAYADPLADRRGADAIVILAGGLDRFVPEFGGASINQRTLARVRYGAWLQRRTGRPVLVTGGAQIDDSPPEAKLMRDTLEKEFAVPVRWTESASTTTRENAVDSRRILAAQRVQRIYLVTHALHLPRARAVFESVGFEVIPAGTGYTQWKPGELTDLLPSASGLAETQYAFYEGMGLLWYMLHSRM